MLTVFVYIFAALTACLFARQAEKSERVWPWLVAAMLPLVLVAACRWDVGSDFYYIYYPSFRAMELHNAGMPAEAVNEIMGPLLERWKLNPFYDAPTGSAAEFCRWYYEGGFCVQERGFTLLEEFCSRTGLGFRGVIAITSLLTGFLVLLAVKRQSVRYAAVFAFFVLMGNYFRSFNVIRQYLAIGFALVSLEFIAGRKPLRFLLCIVTGSLFHKSVLLMLPCYLFAYVPIAPRVALALAVAALAASPLIRPFVRFIPEVIPLGRFAGYFDPAVWTSSGFQWVFFANNAVLLVWGAFCWERVRGRNRFFPVWYSMTAVGTVVLALSGVLPVTNRVNYVFSAPQFLLVPELLGMECRPSLRRLLVIGTYGVFTLGCFYRFCALNVGESMPYNVRRQPNDRMIRRVSRVPFGWMLPEERAK